jgi:Tol biopolymer transport system component
MAAGIDSGTSVVLSPDGRYVAFESNRAGLLLGVSTDQLFLRDLSTGTTSLLSVAATGAGGGNRSSWGPVFSADGHHVAFLSPSDNLVAGVTYHNFYGTTNLFERDLTTGQTALVSVSLDGTHDSSADVNGTAFALSADGRFVVFASSADNLAGQKYNAVHASEVFVRDMQAGVTTQVSVSKDGTGGGNSASGLAQGGQSISADGRYVVFDSRSTDLVPGTVSGYNVYRRDLVTGTTTLVSTGPSGMGTGQSAGEIISPDGRYIAFRSSVNLLPQDTNGKYDVYVYDTAAGPCHWPASTPPAPTAATAIPASRPAPTASTAAWSSPPTAGPWSSRALPLT